MAVVYDSSAAGLQTSGVVSLTFSFDNVSGSALVIGVGGTWPSSSKPNSNAEFITYGGVKFIRTANDVGSNNLGYVGGYLMEPATGANDIVITMQSSTGVTWLNAVVVSVNGATGTPSFKVAVLSSSVLTRSSTISSQTGGIVVSLALLGTPGVSENNNSWRVDSGSNERVASTYVSPWVLKGATKTATYPSTTITWTNNQIGTVTRSSVLFTFSFPPRETVLSPTYYYDFQNDATGYVADGFTSSFDWQYGGDWYVSSVPGESSEKALTNIKSNYGIEGVYNNTIGKINLNDYPIEIAAKFKYQYTDLRSDAVASDFMTIGLLSGNSAIGLSLRYGYGDVFRIQSYSNQQADIRIADRPWKISGALTFTTSSNIVTGVMDPIKPPYNVWFNDYPAYFTVGQYYQIMKLGNSDWNYVANTTGVTYKIGDIIQCVNVGTGDGEAIRKTATKFITVGNDAADKGMAENATLYTMDGTEIGVIQSIESATSLTLTTNAKTNGTVVQAKLHPDSFIPQSNTWYYMRFRRDALGIYKAKIWPVTSIEPEGWLLDSTSYKGQYEHNLIDQYFTTSTIALPTFARGNYYYAQVGISLDGGVASLDGTFPPSITNVGINNTLTSSQTNITVSGYHLTGVTTATIVQGTTSIPQNVTIVSDTTATFDIAFDTNTYDVKYGTAILRFESPTGRSNKSITISPPDARCYRDLTSINSTKDNRLTALPDLDIGDQIEVLSVNGGTISSVNINPDGTFDADSGVTSFYCRAWSASDQTWGNPGLQAMVASAIRRRVIVIL